MIRFLIVASFLFGVFCDHVMLPPEWLLVPGVVLACYGFWEGRKSRRDLGLPSLHG